MIKNNSSFLRGELPVKRYLLLSNHNFGDSLFARGGSCMKFFREEKVGEKQGETTKQDIKQGEAGGNNEGQDNKG